MAKTRLDFAWWQELGRRVATADSIAVQKDGIWWRHKLNRTDRAFISAIAKNPPISCWATKQDGGSLCACLLPANHYGAHDWTEQPNLVKTTAV